ncbi:MAG: hypothetical protein ACYDCK_07430 [Thermoplasmatota archaeon]
MTRTTLLVAATLALAFGFIALAAEPAAADIAGCPPPQCDPGHPCTDYVWAGQFLQCVIGPS